MSLYAFEKLLPAPPMEVPKDLTDEQINEKYESGEVRIITEQGAIKLSLVKNLFSSDNYQLHPEFQRRITWDDKKRSRLIESFIMNIPVPPVFIYETEFNKYQVMDGLQRLSTIIAFYSDDFQLTGLNDWPELNGRTYSTLPQKIKEGIDRRQISVITLLKESSKSPEQAEQMKKMVFERLNTGGITLKEQEIRNALYDGPFNKKCIALSSHPTFKKLWGIESIIEKTEDSPSQVDLPEDIDYIDNAYTYVKNRLYNRMYDVELVLRYFAMRHIDLYPGNLSEFLDRCLRSGNNYKPEDLSTLENCFISNMNKALCLFDNKAFCQYNTNRSNWSSPQKMIYDAMTITLDSITVNTSSVDQENNIELLKHFYHEHELDFNGKKQSRSDILNRVALLRCFVSGLKGVTLND